MKFTPESLIEIYLNGSFTEEAQAEFDALMRSDASFAQRVTDSVAEKLGPLPEGLVEQVAGRLDSKMDGLWKVHQPSPWAGVLKSSLKVFLFLAAACGIYAGYQHFRGLNQQVSIPQGGAVAVEPQVSQGTGSIRVKDHSLTHTDESNGIEGGAIRGEDSGHTVSLSFKELPSASGSNLSTPEALGDSRSNFRGESSGLNVHPSAGAEPGEGSAAKNPPMAQAGSDSQEGDALRVSVEMEKTGKVMVTVLDSNGLLVRSLYQGTWNSGVHLVDWDGKDEAGNQVQPGDYSVAVNAAGKTMSGTLKIRSDH